MRVRVRVGGCVFVCFSKFVCWFGCLRVCARVSVCQFPSVFVNWFVRL